MKKSIGEVRVTYSKSRDEFRIEIWHEGDDEWGLESGYKCMGVGESEKEFVHFSIIKSLLRLLNIGYEMPNCYVITVD